MALNLIKEKKKDFINTRDMVRIYQKTHFFFFDSQLFF